MLFSRTELDSSLNTKVEEDRNVSPKHDVSEVSRCQDYCDDEDMGCFGKKDENFELLRKKDLGTQLNM